MPTVDVNSTVDELSMYPAEVESLAAGTSLWKSQKPVGRKRTLGTMDGIRNCHARRLLLDRPILQEYDASTVEELGLNPAGFGN